jgi:hypothetical protein
MVMGLGVHANSLRFGFAFIQYWITLSRSRSSILGSWYTSIVVPRMYIPKALWSIGGSGNVSQPLTPTMFLESCAQTVRSAKRDEKLHFNGVGITWATGD